MTQSLRVIIIEESPPEVASITRALEEGGFAVEALQVDSATTLKQALSASSWDVVLSDHETPNITAREALALLKESASEAPFIIVSGAIGEETAVELFKAGADDYIPESNLRKLAPAVRRSLREVAGRGRERDARLAADQAVHARERMLAVVSHDLKNPLNAIQLNAKLIERLLLGGSRPDRERQILLQLGRIQRSVDRMGHLISDVLDVAKIEAGRFVVEKTQNSVDELVSELLDFFEPLAMQKSLILKADLPAQPRSEWFDRDKLFQALANLVGNAVKFTPERGTVTVAVEALPDCTRLIVRDSGPGIGAEHKPHVFDRYWQAEQTARHGTGLGLAIAKGIIDAHGGRIWVESELGQGAAFFVTIPHTQSAPEA